MQLISRIAIPALGLLLLLSMTGCPTGEKGEVVAQVNDDRLTKEELAALVPEGYTVDRDNLPKILDKWVSNSLIYQEAVKRGLRDDEEVKLYLQRLERDYLVNALLERVTAGASVTQAEILDYYNEHKDEFNYQVKIARIVLPDSMMAVRTLEEIRGGADFQKLAKERSQDAMLEAGQESRYFARGVGDPRQGGDPDLEEAIFALDKGGVSDVISTQEGYQIVKLVDKKKVTSEVSLSQAGEYIQAVLRYRKSQKLVEDLLSTLRAGATIELKPDLYFE